MCACHLLTYSRNRIASGAMSDDKVTTFTNLTEADLRHRLEDQDYVVDEDLLTTVLLALRMGKPLLVEGQPGSGKTELGKVLAKGFDTEQIRLQCYEGLTTENALYEWNYTKQLLSIQSGEATVTEVNGGSSVFSPEYLEERPLLRALTCEGKYPPVLLIDEVDRADVEFEAFLLELLSDFQVTIPELGTVRAEERPIVIITSNRTRGLSDALKRRCLYYHMEPPSFEKEFEIVRRKVPQLDAAIVAEVCAMAQELRSEPLLKQPGISETLDWSRALVELRTISDSVSSPKENVGCMLGAFLKEIEDIQYVEDELLDRLRMVAEEASRDFNGDSSE